jgi:hypothetical protein
MDYVLLKHQYWNSMKDLQTMPWADIISVHNLLFAKMCTRLKKIMKFQKDKPKWDLEKFYGRRQKVQDTLEEKLREIDWKNENA